MGAQPSFNQSRGDGTVETVTPFDDGSFVVRVGGQVDRASSDLRGEALASLGGGGGGGSSDVGALAHAVAEKVAREQPGVTFKSATVVALDDQPLGQFITAHVAIDGDPPSNTTQAVSEIGAVAIGARVRVKHEPPHGVYLSGILSSNCDPECITFTAFGDVVSSTSPPWPPPDDCTVIEIVAMAGGAATTDSTIIINDNGIEQYTFTLPAGVTVFVVDQPAVDLGYNHAVTVAVIPGDGLTDCTVTLRFCPGGPPPCECPNGCCSGDADCTGSRFCDNGCCQDPV